MHGLLKRRSWRAATTWLLAVMQLHLLLVLVFHHHFVPEIALAFSNTATTTKVQQADRHSHPLNGSRDFCPGCQILRHGAVRPALGDPTARRMSVSPLLAVGAPAVVLIVQPSTWHGRAPPLA